MTRRTTWSSVFWPSLLQVQYTAGTTLFDGEAYSPEYLEFHHPSEHFVSSKQFDLELQIHHVHLTELQAKLTKKCLDQKITYSTVKS